MLVAQIGDRDLVDKMPAQDVGLLFGAEVTPRTFLTTRGIDSLSGSLAEPAWSHVLAGARQRDGSAASVAS